MKKGKLKGVFVGKYGVELGKNHIEIDEFNKKIDKIGKAIDVNENELKIALDAYNQKTNHNLSLEKVLEDINSGTSISKEVKDYIDWRKYNGREVDDVIGGK